MRHFFGHRTLTLVGLFVTGQSILAPAALAHHRDFTFMRDWFLPYKGEMEIESRSFYDTKDTTFNQEFEFEYGVNDSFAIEPGFAFHKDPGDKVHLDEYGVELRFRLGEFATNKILPALNIGYEHPIADESNHGEIRFIASYMTDAGTDITANLAFGQRLSGDPESDGEFDLGVMVPVGKNSREEMGYNIGIRAGAEFIRDIYNGNMKLGPTLVFRHNKNFNALGTFAFPLNNTDDNHPELRFIMEYEF